MMTTRNTVTALTLTLALFAGASAEAAKARIVPLSAVETEDLLFMREEEKLARDTYLTMYEKWQLGVFSSISLSEQSHMDTMLRLVTKYKLTDPAANTAIGEFRNPELQSLYKELIDKGNISSLEALQVGALIEEVDMRDIVATVDRTTHADLVKAYNNLLCGSRNHLRAFSSSIVQETGAPYTAQILDQNTVDTIINSPKETCGN